jgi:hypothetical protein
MILVQSHFIKKKQKLFLQEGARLQQESRLSWAAAIGCLLKISTKESCKRGIKLLRLVLLGEHLAD